MTTINGSFASCGLGQWFSLEYDCTGSDCSTLEGFPNVTCESNGSSYSCSNRVNCPASTNYTTKFSFSKQGNTITQTEEVTVMGCHFLVSTNGTAAGTVATQNNCTNGTSSKSVGHRLSPRKLLIFLLFAGFLVQGCIACDLSLVRREEDPPWLFIAKKFINFILEKDLNHDPFFADNLVNTVYETLCQFMFSAAGTTTDLVLGATEPVVEGCTATIIALCALEPPVDVVAAFGAHTVCDVSIAWAIDNLPLGSGKLGDVVDEFCKQPKPCGDLLTDPQNCGKCRFQVLLCFAILLTLV